MCTNTVAQHILCKPRKKMHYDCTSSGAENQLLRLHPRSQLNRSGMQFMIPFS